MKCSVRYIYIYNLRSREHVMAHILRYRWFVVLRYVWPGWQWITAKRPRFFLTGIKYYFKGFIKFFTVTIFLAISTELIKLTYS